MKDFTAQGEASIAAVNIFHVNSVGICDLFGADPDQDLWQTDPDPTPFFSDFKDAKKIHIFFL